MVVWRLRIFSPLLSTVPAKDLLVSQLCPQLCPFDLLNISLALDLNVLFNST